MSAQPSPERLTAPCTCHPSGERPNDGDLACDRSEACYAAWLDRQMPTLPAAMVAAPRARDDSRYLAGYAEGYRRACDERQS